MASRDDHKWHKYLSKNGERYKFQMDLGQSLISYGLEMDWEDGFDEDVKPPYVRNLKYVPCACKRCFFCKNGKTSPKKSPKKRAKECPEERTLLAAHSRRCKSCNNAKYSTMGCSFCQVICCKECWLQCLPH